MDKVRVRTTFAVATAVTFIFTPPSQAQNECTILHQVAEAAGSGFDSLKSDATKFTGRDVWRSRVTLPYTGACIVDPAGAHNGSPPVFDCFSVDVPRLAGAISACFPDASREVPLDENLGDAITFDLGSIMIMLDLVGHALRILPE